jgi:hypothetical protein
MSGVAVAVVGLGPIGREVVKAVVARPELRLVGAADPAFAGRDAGELSEIGALGVPVSATTAEAVAGVDIVSTCEDLAYAPLATPDLAGQLDARARAAGISIVGTGVNPGLVMDRLPLTLAAACVRIDRVAVTRVVDAAKRRAPLRAKVGAGLTPAEFQEGVAARRLSHRGLPESCALIGLGLGWTLDEIRSTIEPVLEPRAGVPAGRVAGLRQSAAGLRAGREVVRLDLEMSMAPAEPHDRVVIEGDPPLDMVIRGGPLITSAPGLRTVLDLALRG